MPRREKGEEEHLRLRVQPEPELVDKGGVLVVRSEPLEDLTDITRRERDRRVLNLVQQAVPLLSDGPRLVWDEYGSSNP